MPPHDRSRVIAAAQAILDEGGWCVFEVCTDVPGQCWEARVVIFDLVAEAVAEQLDGSDVSGILSMRDIVRCWTSDGASCEVAE